MTIEYRLILISPCSIPVGYSRVLFVNENENDSRSRYGNPRVLACGRGAPSYPFPSSPTTNVQKGGSLPDRAQTKDQSPSTKALKSPQVTSPQYPNNFSSKTAEPVVKNEQRKRRIKRCLKRATFARIAFFGRPNTYVYRSKKTRQRPPVIGPQGLGRNP